MPGSELDNTIVENVDALARAPLIRKRGKIKAKLTASEKTLSNIDENTDFATLNLESRSETHMQLWDKFNSVQEQIESTMSHETDFENLDSEQETFENRFHNICGLLKKYIKNPVFAPRSNSSQSDAGSIVALTEGRNSVIQSNSSSNEQNTIQPNIPLNVQTPTTFNARFELPKLQAPSFNVNLDTWLTFHDSFRSMCHDNPCISTIQKFHYLKACLKDEAAEVIAALEIT